MQQSPGPCLARRVKTMITDIFIHIFFGNHTTHTDFIIIFMNHVRCTAPSLETTKIKNKIKNTQDDKRLTHFSVDNSSRIHSTFDAVSLTSAIK
jgi:hypothetical protein